MDEQLIVSLYTVDKWSLRRIASHVGTDHHRVKRILLKHSVSIKVKGQKPKPYTDEHKHKVGLASRGREAWNAGQTMSEASRRTNMAAKLKTSIDLDRYPDYDKLKFLTHFLSKRKKHIGYNDSIRQEFLDKFYFDPAFNRLYDQWAARNRNRWYRPTLDHIEPQANGGSWELDNLQFLTWFENRAKADMSNHEWECFKDTTHTHSDLFQ